MTNIILRHSLVTRILVYVLIVIGFVSFVSIAFSYRYTTRIANHHAIERVHELINAVEPNLRISSYLNDKQLAKEVVKGLLSSHLIEQVIVRTTNKTILASGSNIFPNYSKILSGKPIVRDIESPFEPGEMLGSLHVDLNQTAIDQKISESLWNVAIPLLSQAIFAAISLILAFFLLLLPRFKKLMAQLITIKAEFGETLYCDGSDSNNELGALVHYINQLILHMYKSITNERELRKQQEIEERKYRSIFDNAITCIFLTDRQGQLTSVNSACEACNLISIHKNYNKNKNIAEILADGDIEFQSFIEKSITEQREIHFEKLYTTKGVRSKIWLQINLTPIDETTVQGVINDITELKTEIMLEYESARTDPLTKLNNRLGFNEMLDSYLKMVSNKQHSLVIMMLDLDKFKQVNDTFGHEAGDFVLIQTTSRLKHAVRGNDYIARLGGDEFVILLLDIDRNISECIARNIISSFEHVITLDNDNTASVGASIGIVMLNEGDTISAIDLLRHADEAMYKIKDSGRNNYGFFDLQSR